MTKYQIEFHHGGESFSYKYFEAEENIGQAACECAGAAIKREKENMRGFSVFDPPETLMVREWDKEKKDVKKGGHQFKLTRRYFDSVDGKGLPDYFYVCKKADATKPVNQD